MNKRKLCALALLIILIPMTSKSQVAYQDALKLAELNPEIDSGYVIFSVANGNNLAAAEILKNYTDKSTYGDIQKEFSKNPFLRLPNITAQSTNQIAGSVSGFISNLGGLDVTTQAQGIALFMISRAKEELTIAFFKRFQNAMEDNPEIQALFPKTSNTLGHLLTYHYPEMLPALQKAFYDDLNMLPNHLADVLELPRYREMLLNFPEVRIAIHTLQIIRQLEDKNVHPSEIIAQFSRLTEWDEPNGSVHLKNMGNSIQLADILSQGLIKEDSVSKDWISMNDLLALIQDQITFKIYLGLIYQQAVVEKVEFIKKDGSTKSFSSIMEENKDNLFLFQIQLTEFIQLADNVKSIRSDIKYKQQNKVELTNDDYYRYVSAGIDVVEYCFNTIKIFDESFVAEDYLKILRGGNDLYGNIFRKEYSAAVVNAVDILSSIQTVVGESNDKKIIEAVANISSRSDEIKKIVDDVKKSKARPSDKDLKVIISQLNSLGLTEEQKKNIQAKSITAALDNLLEVIPEISKYGLFIANVSSAETPEEVQEIIESAVLPVGSSSIKKNSKLNLSVQSYLGAYWSMTEDPNKVQRAWGDKFGVIAPIGLSFSYGLEKWGSVSLFASLIDLGAIVDYELKYDSVTTTSQEVSKEYTVNLGQIFSPGGYFVYGFPFDLPLSLGIGGQYGPGLSSIESTEDVVDNPYWRWSIFLCVDIPLFNLYNKERKK